MQRDYIGPFRLIPFFPTKSRFFSPGGRWFSQLPSNRLKILVHDGVGLWLAARRLHQGKFVWAPPGSLNVALEHAQLGALVLGLPWQRVGSQGAITVI